MFEYYNLLNEELMFFGVYLQQSNKNYKVWWKK
jgi:hypothetical protein